MRIITGNHGIVSVSHLEWETKLLPVHIHLCMVRQQFTASAFRLNHSSHDIVSTPVHQPRVGTHQEMANPPKSLRSAYYEDISEFLVNGALPED